MSRAQLLKLVYLLGSALWVAHIIQILYNVPAADRNPNISGAIYCVLAVGILPAALGYVLVFKILPWTTRGLRRS